MPRKHTRSNQKRYQQAKRLVASWYAAQLADGRQRYASDREVAVTMDTGSTREPVPQQQPWDQPATANGRETKPERTSQLPRGKATDPYVRGTYRHDEYVEHVRKAMRHVQEIAPDAHQVLEMDAAGWQLGDIREQIGCNEMAARLYLAEGLGVIMGYQAMARSRQTAARPI